jgi:hypothetical protein
MIKFSSLELSEQVEKPTSLWIEYNTLHSSQDPVRFKVNIPPKLSKPVIRVPFLKTHRLPDWNSDPKLIIRIFALGKRKDIKARGNLGTL